MHRRSRGVSAVVVGLAVLVTVPCAWGAQIWVTGVLEENPGKYSKCVAVSEDGQWVVGSSKRQDPTTLDLIDWPFYWSKTTGIQDMGNPGNSSSAVTGCTTGSGGVMLACGNIGGMARRWSGGNWTVLPGQSSTVRSVYAITRDSGTGSTWIAGSSYPNENEKAYLYDWLNNSYIDYWGYYQDAYGIAHNGWAVGKNNWGNGQENPEYRYNHPIFIFDWNHNGGAGGSYGWDQLKRFAGYGDSNFYKGQATAIGVTAKWAAGYMTYDPANLGLNHAFKWKVPTSPVVSDAPGTTWDRPIDLGTLGTGDTISYAYAISSDATSPVVGGTSYGTQKYTGYKAVYWDGTGIHDLYAVLQGLGIDMTRWASLARVYGVSSNGRIFVGVGSFDDDADSSTAAVDMGFMVDLDGTGPQPPVITSHPQNLPVCNGGTGSFHIGAVGGGVLNYQWQKNQVNLTNGGHYSGATTTTLVITGTDSGDVASYRCTVTNTDGSATSNEAALTLVMSVPAAPADATPVADAVDKITWKWADVSGEANYRVRDTGGTNLSGLLAANTVQWQETSLSVNTMYSRRVVAINACGESAASAGQSRYTLASPPTYGTGTTSPTVSSDRGFSMTGLAANAAVTFTATNGFGDGAARVGQFGYLWDQSSGSPSSWSGEQYWTSGTLVTQVGASGDWYLHLRSYNNDSPKAANTTTYNFGPYTVGGSGGATCLQNAGFESGFASGVGNNWSKFAYLGSVTCSDSTSSPHGGSHCQQVVVASSSNQGGVYQQFQTTPNTTYTVKVWIKVASSTNTTGYLGVDPYGGTDSTSGNVWWGGKNSTTWSQKTWTGTALASKLTVYLDAESNNSSSATVWFDDAEPVCSNVPSAPVDGTPVALSTTSIRWMWTDVANETGYRAKNTGGTAVSGDLAANTTQWDETTGITANTQYTRRIYAFNADGESSPSTGQTRYSLIETPTGITFGAVTATSIVATASGTISNPAAGSSGVRISNTTSSDNSGWLTSAGPWTSSGLVANTQCSFLARARNGDAVETADSAAATKWTLSNPPVADSVTASRTSLCAATDIVWTAVGGFGSGKIQYYRTAWDQSPTHAWTDAEPIWSSGTITTVPTAAGTWYLHVKGYNGADVANGTFDYAITAGAVVAADFNGDCAVDQSDLAIFAPCVTGPDVPYAGGSLPGCGLAPNGQGIIAADFDGDGDVDQEDFGRLQRCYSGTGNSPDPHCAD